MAFLVFFFGLCMGSFLCLVVYRVPLQKSIIWGRSTCEKCNTVLSFMDLIPVLGYLLGRGKCRYCGNTIRLWYPIMEMLNGFFALSCFLLIEDSVFAILFFLFVNVLIALSIVDYQTMEIPDGFVWCLFILSVLFSFVEKRPLSIGVISALAVVFPMICMNRFKKHSFGGGDIKLMAACGFLGVTRILVAFWIAVFLAGVYALYLLFQKQNIKERYIAFGPYLSIGLIVSLCVGKSIATLYFSQFL